MDDLKRLFTFVGEDEQPVGIRFVYLLGLFQIVQIIAGVLMLVLGD